MKKLRKINSESGQISILTVVVFMMLFSVVVVSFTRVMVAASHETTSDELRAKAIAAAHAGIEDAKRILTYCYYINPDDTACKQYIADRIGDQTCKDIIRPSGILSKLGVQGGDITEITGGTSTYQVKVGDGDQYYSCMQIASVTPSYEKHLEEGQSVVIPLHTVCKPNSGGAAKCVDDTAVGNFTIEWHDKDINGGPVALKNGSDFPSMPQWGANNPATLHAEFIIVDKNSFTINGLMGEERVWTMRPTAGSAGAVTGSSLTNINGFKTGVINPNKLTSVPNNSSLLPVQCSTSPSGSSYACSIKICQKTPDTAIDACNTGTSWALNGGYLYLRLRAIYAPTDIRVTAYHPSDGQLYFKNIQPEIDVTGRAGDSFQRIQARVEPGSNGVDGGWWPEYAIDSGGKVCKDMGVKALDGEDNCSYN